MFTVLDKKKAKPVPIKEVQDEAQEQAQEQVSDEEAGKMLAEMLGGDGNWTIVTGKHLASFFDMLFNAI